MSGAVAETQGPPTARACAQCGYDLRGLGTVQEAATCPECGAVAGSWRSAYAAPWLVVPALRLLVWGIPSVVGAVCIARLIDVVRGAVSYYDGLILSSDAVLLHALPVVASLLGAGLLGAASPGGRSARAGIIVLCALTIGCVGAMVANHWRLSEYLSGVTTTRTLSYTMNWGMGAMAARLGIVGAGAVGVACVWLLARLGSELGWSWFAVWRSRLTVSVASVLLIALMLRELMQAVIVAGAQGSPAGMPQTTPRSWMDPVLLGLGAMLLGLIWSLAFAALARIRSLNDGPTGLGGAG